MFVVHPQHAVRAEIVVIIPTELPLEPEVDPDAGRIAAADEITQVADRSTIEQEKSLASNPCDHRKPPFLIWFSIRISKKSRGGKQFIFFQKLRELPGFDLFSDALHKI